MTIGIDARLYGTKHGGIGRYTKELIRNLLKIDSENQYVFFVYNKEDKIQLSNDLPARNFSFVITPYRWYSLKEQLFMGAAIKKTNVDLMHFTHFNVPLLYTKPFIVTIHDLIIHHFPTERATTLPNWLYRIKLAVYKKVMKHAVKKARAIITPTQFGKQDLLDFYTISKQSVHVIGEGTSALTAQKGTNIQSDEASTVPTKVAPHQKGKSYLLYVGSFYPHKNIERLIDAFFILRNRYKLDLSLMLVGKQNYFQTQVKNYLTTQYQLPQNSYQFFGYATDTELAQLYQNAALYIFPSLYEGFGLPPLEAMQYGTPVVSSNASCMPEVLGESAVYFDPKNPKDIAEKIAQVYQNPELQQTLRKKGIAQTKKYSWESMARETLRIYKSML